MDKYQRGNRHSLKMGFVHVNVLDRFVLNVAGGRFFLWLYFTCMCSVSRREGRGLWME